MTARRVTISLSPEVLREIERLRKETGESRSGVCERALRAYLDQREARAARQSYAEAYLRQPESAAEVREALATAAAALALEPWDEEG